jgi:hypothetical protein
MHVCFRQDVVLIGKESENSKVQKHLEDSIGWLNAYFSDAGHVNSRCMPDICVARDMGRLPCWFVDFSFVTIFFTCSQNRYI